MAIIWFMSFYSGICPDLNSAANAGRFFERNLSLNGVTYTDKRQLGTMAIYECAFGFAPVESLNRTCLEGANGARVWSEPEPICERKCIMYNYYMHFFFLKFQIHLQFILHAIAS